MMQNEKRFRQQMAGVAEVFDKPLTKLLVHVYWQALAQYSDGDCEYAFAQSVLQGRFFPRPAELINYIKARHPAIDVEDVARQQAHLVLQDIRGGKVPGYSDPITIHLLQSRFRIESLKATMLEKNEQWFVRDFIEAYCSEQRMADTKFIQITGDNKKLLKLTEGIGEINEN